MATLPELLKTLVEVDGSDLDARARALFEHELVPFAVLNHDSELGLFTGYYEPLLRGSRKRGGAYQVPLYRRPRDLVAVDLGDFRETLRGQRIAGRLYGDRLVPYPDRAASERVQTDFPKVGSLTFEEPDVDRFPALELARRAGEVGGTLPAVLNAANEIAVEAFVNRKINFPQITATVRRVMDAHQVVAHPSLERILAADAWAR